MEYGGQLRTQAWLDSPGQNLIYVWSDLDNLAALQKTGQPPVIIDANPAYTDSWGGRINDGLTHGANVEFRRDKHSDKVYIWALETLTPGTELTVHYGPDYWQEHFFHCPASVQQDAAQCYALVALDGPCFQTKELRNLRSAGKAHQKRGHWFLGPRPGLPTAVDARRPSPSRRPRSGPLIPLPEPSPAPPARAGDPGAAEGRDPTAFEGRDPAASEGHDTRRWGCDPGCGGRDLRVVEGRHEDGPGPLGRLQHHPAAARRRRDQLPATRIRRFTSISILYI